MRTDSLIDIAKAVAGREASAEKIALQALRKVEEYDAVQPQAWIARCGAIEVLAQAREVDARIAAGESLALPGVPFAVKDNIDVAGMPTSAACPTFSYRAEQSAVVVERLRAAGAILLGKTNLDQFATGLTGTRSPYGIPGCVYNREYVAGGSSSGSAVLVGAGVVPLALGSDTAGSGRVPAAFNHLVGLKPTRGRWSTRGLVPACRSLDCVSAFTRTAAEAIAVDRVLTAYDAEDPYSRRVASNASLGAAFRLGVPLEAQLSFSDAETRGLFAAALERVQSLGGMVHRIDIQPLLECGQLLYEGPWLAERALAIESMLASRSSALHPVVRAIVQAGCGIGATEAFRGLHSLKSHARAAQAIWERVDVLLVPTTTQIHRIAEVLADPFTLNSQLGRYTNFVNLLDFSALAVPAGFRTNRTPFGVTLMGPAWADDALLELAMRLEHTRPLEPAPPLDRHAHPSGTLLAVVGAHLSGMPLHWQLSARGARFIERTRTAATYRLYALSESAPPKPALVHTSQGGNAIEVELYELDPPALGDFLCEVPPPLAIGTVHLHDGRMVRGFVAEPRALEGALDITASGGWRAYMAGRGSFS